MNEPTALANLPLEKMRDIIEADLATKTSTRFIDTPTGSAFAVKMAVEDFYGHDASGELLQPVLLMFGNTLDSIGVVEYGIQMANFDMLSQDDEEAGENHFVIINHPTDANHKMIEDLVEPGSASRILAPNVHVIWITAP